MRIEKKTLNDALRVLGKVVKFVLFFTSRCVFWKRKAAGWKLKESCRHPYDPYVACPGVKKATKFL